MKSTLFLATIPLFCIGFSLVGVVSPTRADVSDSAQEEVPEEFSPETTPSQNNADLLIVEPRGLELATDPDANALDAVADQINQGIDSDSDEFLPEGMVVRGSEGSVQVGSEI